MREDGSARLTSWKLLSVPPKWNRTSQTAFLFARAIFSSRRSLVVVGTELFGMSITVVNPPAIAALLPVAKSSLYVSPGSRRWTCGSMRPGRTIRLLASMRSSPSSLSPIFDMTPFSMRMSFLWNSPRMNAIPFLMRRLIGWKGKGKIINGRLLSEREPDDEGAEVAYERH